MSQIYLYNTNYFIFCKDMDGEQFIQQASSAYRILAELLLAQNNEKLSPESLAWLGYEGSLSALILRLVQMARFKEKPWIHVKNAYAIAKKYDSMQPNKHYEKPWWTSSPVMEKYNTIQFNAIVNKEDSQKKAIESVRMYPCNVCSSIYADSGCKIHDTIYWRDKINDRRN